MPPFRRLIVGIASLGAVLSIVVISSATAPAGRYSISGGTVLDTKTGLTWQQSAASQTYTGATAPAFCATVGAGWRLPTVKELATLIDFSVASPGPMIDTTAFPGTPTDMSFLTSTVFSTVGNWDVSFKDATICDNCSPTGVSRHVRCVH
jgi:hypothetical protein